jgi:hypothetical protein
MFKSQEFRSYRMWESPARALKKVDLESTAAE